MTACRPCTNGDHPKCCGISCTCRETERCEENAELTIEREA